MQTVKLSNVISTRLFLPRHCSLTVMCIGLSTCLRSFVSIFCEFQSNCS